MMGRMSNLRARTLAKAAVILGGIDKLAADLGITPATLGMLIRGEVSVPPELFLRATEIITDEGLTDASKPTASKKDAEKRRS